MAISTWGVIEFVLASNIFGQQRKRCKSGLLNVNLISRRKVFKKTYDYLFIKILDFYQVFIKRICETFYHQCTCFQGVEAVTVRGPKNNLFVLLSLHQSVLRDESCHCTNVCKVLFQIFRVITDLKISTYIGKSQFCFSAQVRYKTKGGLLNMIYNIMQIKMSQYGSMGLLVNTLSKSFRHSGATKTF